MARVVLSILLVMVCATASSPERFDSVHAAGQDRITIGGGPGRGNFPPPPISASQSDAERSAALDRYLSQLASEDRFSGVVLLVKNGRAVFEKAYGYADRALRVPNTPATRFNIASVNKQFTIAAIDLLVGAGKMSRDDTVGKFLPDYPNEQGRKATVQQLLDHRGGVSDFFGPDFDKASKADFRSNRDYFRFVAPRPLYFEPGAERRYCNGCYIVLGEIVERVAGVPYERFVAERVFAPRGMTQSGWPASDEVAENVARGYTRRAPGADGALRSNLFTHGAAGSAAGGGYSTTADLLAFFKDGPTGNGRSMNAGIAGGAPGCAALVEGNEPWLVIVLSNMDPPAASVGAAILRQLRQK
jgi:CubicO group peptidase (beta-lactamase class C family)